MKNDEIGGYLIGIFHGAVIGVLLTLALKGHPSDQPLEKRISEPKEIMFHQSQKYDK